MNNLKRLIYFIPAAMLIAAFWLFSEPEIKPNFDVRLTKGAYQGLHLWSTGRAYPNAVMPDKGHFTAFEQAKNHHALTKSSFDTDPWYSLGPVNIGGRTLAIAINPENPVTIYAGSASGGLWRSRTGGRGRIAWELISTGFPVLAVSAIAISPQDTNTIYIGTGEVYAYQNAGFDAANRGARGSYGIGILKSTDGGATWSKSLDWTENQQRGVQAIRFNPLNPRTIWAATTEGTFKSTDAGATWENEHPVRMATDLAIAESDTNTVIAGYGNFGSLGHGIYRTVNGGNTWTKITTGVPQTFNGKVQLGIFNSPFQTVIYASIGNGFQPGINNASWLCKSVNKGQSWSIVSEVDFSQWQGWFSHDVAVSPTNPDIITVVGIDTWISDDGGVTLTKKSVGPDPGAFRGQVPPGEPEGVSNYVHSDIHDVVYHPSDPNIFYLACDGGVFRTTDGGQTFDGCNGGYQTIQFYNGFASSRRDSNFAIGGLQDNHSIIYKGSQIWSKFHFDGDGGWAAIDPRDDQVVYATAQRLFLVKSSDGGDTFFNIVPPGRDIRPAAFISPFVVGVDNPDIIYGGRDIVYKSANGGAFWLPTNGAVPVSGGSFGLSPLVMAISHQNSDIVYLGAVPLFGIPGPARVFRTTNGGTSWDDITGPLPDRFHGDMAIDPNDDATVYLTFSGFGSSHVYKTNDRGDTWQDINGALPDVPTSAVTVDPLFPDQIYVGNDIGVYASVDGGETWEDFSEGLPDAIISIDLSISNTNRKLRVATHGNGVYERQLIGKVPTGIEDEAVVINEFSLSQNYPNPFNPTTNIRFRIAEFGFVELKIYDVGGRLVKTLVSENRAAGFHSAQWDASNQSGEKVASGTYFYKLQAGASVQIRKMIVMK